MNVPFPPPRPATLAPLLIAIAIQVATLLLLLGFERGLFLRLPKLVRFGAHVLFDVLSFLFIFGLLLEFMSDHLPLAARIALSAWMVFVIAAMGWSFFAGWISKDSVTGWTVIITTILCVFLTLGSFTGSAREAARRTQCRNNLKRIAAALVEYAEKNGRFPQTAERRNSGPPVSWRATFLAAADPPSPVPYDRSQSWDAPDNRAAANSNVLLYSCPSDWNTRDEQGRWLTSYALVTGPGTIFPREKPLAPQEISDGASATLLAVEAAGLQIVWSEPRDADVSREPIGINLAGDQVGRSPGLLSSYHPGVAMAVMADGSTRLLSERIDQGVLRALTTANGHESVERRLPD